LREPAPRIQSREAVPAASLDFVLRARDRRASLQKGLLAAYGLPVLSLTLVSPGPVKDSPGRRLLMDLAENAFAEAFHRARWTVRLHSRSDGIAGPEALWVTEVPPDHLKRLAMRIENAKPWGRLLDADVVLAGPCKEPMPLGRQALGGEPRRCLLCEAEARECIGLRRHHPASAAAMVEALIGRFTGLP